MTAPGCHTLRGNACAIKIRFRKTSQSETRSSGKSLFVMSKTAGIPIISISEVQERLGAPGFFVFDITTPVSFRKSHLRGAVYLEPDFTSDSLPPNEDAALVFYAFGPKDPSAVRAAKRAQLLGFSNVSVLRAGIFGWIRAGNSVTSARTLRLKPEMHYH
jgi:rhodanese-related sulfurtransferase